MSYNVLEAMRRLLRRSQEPSWTEDDQGIYFDAKHALDLHESFEFRNAWRDDRTIVLEAEWRNRGHGLTRDFCEMFGECAEMISFIARTETEDAVLFHVVMGAGSHGHLLRFRLIGQGIRKI